MESSKHNLRDSEFWRAHVLQAEEFSGTYASYCESNGLSKSTFNAHKKRLGFTRVSKSKRRAFVEVAPICNLSKEPPKTRSERTLPNPRWVAEVLMAMVGER